MQRTVNPDFLTSVASYNAVLVEGSNCDGAWRGMVTILEFIDPRSYISQVTVYNNLIYTVLYVSESILTQANSNPGLLPVPSCVV